MPHRALSFIASPIAAPPPAPAAPPPFETPARVAYMVDLSPGAVLYSKDPDRRIPPASMAKMMTTHLAFKLIKDGEIKLDQMCQVRPETWRQWHGPQAGSTMFLSPGEQASVDVVGLYLNPPDRALVLGVDEKANKPKGVPASPGRHSFLPR